MFSLEFSNKSAKFFKNCDMGLSKRIVDKIKNLKENPVPSDAKFMGRHNNDKVFRIRVGKYRILYKIKDNEKVILIVDIDKRERIYD